MARLAFTLVCASTYAICAWGQQSTQFLAQRASSARTSISQAVTEGASGKNLTDLPVASKRVLTGSANMVNPNTNGDALVNPNTNPSGAVNPNTNTNTVNPNPNSGSPVKPNPNPRGAALVTTPAMINAIKTDILAHRKWSVAAVLGPATGTLVAQLITMVAHGEGSFSIVDGLSWMGVTSISLIAASFNPVCGVIAMTLFSFLSGLLGGLFGGGASEAPGMQDLMEEMMEDVKDLIKYSVMKEKMTTISNKLLGITEELSWVPQLLQASHTAETAAPLGTLFNYNLVVQHDLGVMIYDMFHGDCVKFMLAYGSDYHLNLDRKAANCKEWQEAGTFVLAYQYVMLHTNQILKTAQSDATYRAGLLDRLRDTFALHYRLLKDSFQTYKLHRLNMVKPLREDAMQATDAFVRGGWAFDQVDVHQGLIEVGLSDKFFEEEHNPTAKYFGQNCGFGDRVVVGPPDCSYDISVYNDVGGKEPCFIVDVKHISMAQAETCYDNYYKRIEGELEFMWDAMEAAMDHVRAPLVTGQSVSVPECAWSTTDIDCEFVAGSYAVGRLYNADCPAGSSPIADASSCQAAAHFLGHNAVLSTGLEAQQCYWCGDCEKQHIGLASTPAQVTAATARSVVVEIGTNFRGFAHAHETLQAQSHLFNNPEKRCVRQSEALVCAADAGSKEKRVNTDYPDANDSFDITVEGQEVCARRIRSSHTEWSMNLKILCEKASGPDTVASKFKPVCRKDGVSKHWVIRTDTNEKTCVRDDSASNGLSVGTTCCDVSSGKAARPDCKTGSFASSRNHCSLLGLRLCSLEELEGGGPRTGAGHNTGCFF